MLWDMHGLSTLMTHIIHFQFFCLIDLASLFCLHIKLFQEAAGGDDDDDDLDLFGDETEEEKKAAEEREAAAKKSAKKKESEFRIMQKLYEHSIKNHGSRGHFVLS